MSCTPWNRSGTANPTVHKPAPPQVWTKLASFYSHPLTAASCVRIMRDSSPEGSLPPAFVRRQVEFVLEQVKGAGFALQGARILDLACGIALHSKQFAAHGIRADGVDCNASAIALATKSVKQAKFLQAELDDPALDLSAMFGSGYDAVLMMYGTWCTLPPEARERIARQVQSLLKPGGLLLIDGFFAPESAGAGEAPRLVYQHSYWDGFAGFWGFFPRSVHEEEWEYPGTRIRLERYLLRGIEFAVWKEALDPLSAFDACREFGFRDREVWAGSFGVALRPEWGAPGVNDRPKVLTEPEPWKGHAWWTLKLEKAQVSA